MSYPFTTRAHPGLDLPDGVIERGTAVRVEGVEGYFFVKTFGGNQVFVPMSAMRKAAGRPQVEAPAQGARVEFVMDTAVSRVPGRRPVAKWARVIAS